MRWWLVGVVVVLIAVVVWWWWPSSEAIAIAPEPEVPPKIDVVPVRAPSRVVSQTVVLRSEAAEVSEPEPVPVPVPVPSSLDGCYREWLAVSPSLGSVAAHAVSDAGAWTVTLRDGGAVSPWFEACLRQALAGSPPTRRSLELVFVPPPEVDAALAADLRGLCDRLGAESRRLARTGVPGDDLLTVALAALEKQTPRFGPYFAELLPGHVPPPQRRATFERAIGSALGGAWECEVFGTLWDGEVP